MLEVFHLLHCLDSLRKAMNRGYYAAGQSEEGTKADRVHDGKSKSFQKHVRILTWNIEHCLDILRVHIQCTGDVTPITFYNNVLVPSRTLPMPDFNTLHTCRNFDDILEWNANNERTMQWDEIGLDLADLMHVD